MGLWDTLFPKADPAPRAEPPNRPVASVRISDASTSQEITGVYSSREFFTGKLCRCDYEMLLRNKQDWHNFVTLCRISDYYSDKDPLYRGLIKQVLTPFSLSDKWILTGADERVKKKYEKHYEKIELFDFMEDALFQYWKYSNVYCYMMPNGSLITLPIHMCRIANVMVNGEPVVEFHCRPIRDDYDRYRTMVLKDYVDDEDLEIRLEGLPPEVSRGLQEGSEWVQLDTDRTFVLQDAKESWVRYCPPIICAMLDALRRKEQISDYEAWLLTLGARPFVLGTYGDPDNEVMTTTEDLQDVGGNIFNAMTTTSLAMCSSWTDAKVVQIDMSDVFDNDKYANVNSDILEAGGISGIIVNGKASDGSTFATAQVSMKTAARRIQRAKDKFAQMMNKFNKRLNEIDAFPHSNKERIPNFSFPVTDLEGDSSFMKVCENLFTKGLLSTETYLSSYGMDFEQEKARRRKERNDGTEDLFTPRSASNNSSATSTDSGDSTGVNGRPTLDDDERHSDPSKSQTGRQPKPSSPDGSEAQDV